MNIFDWLFKEGSSINNLYIDDPSALVMNQLGNISLALFLTISGIAIFFISKLTYPPTKMRRYASFLFSIGLIFAGLSRALDLYAIFHNFVNLRGLVKDIGGICGMAALMMVPFVRRDLISFKNLVDAKKILDSTNRKLDEVKEIHKKSKGL